MLSTLLYAFLGLVVGVVVNRAADNLPPPARRSMLDAPRCGFCGTPREAWEQIGIVGFLRLRGRCSHCQSPLAIRNPIVEIGSALLFAFLSVRSDVLWTTAVYSLVTAILLLITVIDLEHRLILNVVVLPATPVAVLLSPVLLKLPSPLVSVLSALLGLAVGYFSVLAIYFLGKLFVRVMIRARGRGLDEVAFGLGDVKLAGLVGALVGFPAVVLALVYAILLGGIVSLFVVLFQLVVKRRYAAFMAIPYGPFITITAWLVMIWGSNLVHAYLG